MKAYNIILETMGPVHVGDSQTLNKKSYVYDINEKIVHVPNYTKLMKWIIKNNKTSVFEDFFKQNNLDLYQWLKQNNMLKDFKSYMDYNLSTKSLMLGSTTRLNDIETTTKTHNNEPYIPGSTLKGMVRNALLTAQGKVYNYGVDTGQYIEDIIII